MDFDKFGELGGYYLGDNKILRIQELIYLNFFLDLYKDNHTHTRLCVCVCVILRQKTMYDHLLFDWWLIYDIDQNWISCEFIPKITPFS